LPLRRAIAGHCAFYQLAQLNTFSLVNSAIGLGTANVFAFAQLDAAAFALSPMAFVIAMSQ